MRDHALLVQVGNSIEDLLEVVSRVFFSQLLVRLSLNELGKRLAINVLQDEIHV